MPHNATCEHPAGEDLPPGQSHCWACTCVNGTEPCDAGQTCVWFSQGCSIGCATCDGNESNPNTRDRCNSGMKATNNDPYFRTYNRGVEAMSPGDIYQWNPWRAPGSAPVFDPCGMAGGSPAWTATQLSFIDTVNNKQGEAQTLRPRRNIQSQRRTHAPSIIAFFVSHRVPCPALFDLPSLFLRRPWQQDAPQDTHRGSVEDGGVS